MHCSNTVDSTIALQVCLLLQVFPLHLVQEVKVWLVEVMYPHVTVLSSAAVSSALRMHGDVVERAEVTPHTTNLLTEDLVVEAGLEFSLACARGCDIHGGLSTSEDNVVFDRGHGGAVEGGVGGI